MSIKDTLSEKVPSKLKLSLSYLIEEFGDTDNILFGLVVNIGLAAPGIAVAFLATNPIFQFLGVVWVFINILPILSWVIGL